jgi:hypothetical protein
VESAELMHEQKHVYAPRGGSLVGFAKLKHEPKRVRGWRGGGGGGTREVNSFFVPN